MTGNVPMLSRPIRALIVDDEYPARAELRYQLSQYEDVEVTGEAATAREALQLIQALKYDAVFLDIAMPGMSGIDLAHQLLEKADPTPYVIFVTAYDEYALKAFEAQALDYILKPINSERVAETVNRLRRRLGDDRHHRVDATTTPVHPRPVRWVMGIRDETSIPIPIETIAYATSEGDQVFVYTATQRYLTRYTLRDLEHILPSDRFFRCHRGYIVNLRFVREISPFFNGTYTLSVASEGGTTSIPVSRSRVPQLKKLFWPE